MFQGFGSKLIQAQQLVWQSTRKIRPNVVVCGMNGAFLARQLDGFTSQEQANPVGVNQLMCAII